MNELEHLKNIVNAWDHWIFMKLRGEPCRIVTKSRIELHTAIDAARKHVEAYLKLEECFYKIRADICKALHIDPKDMQAPVSPIPAERQAVTAKQRKRRKS